MRYPRYVNNSIEGDCYQECGSLEVYTDLLMLPTKLLFMYTGNHDTSNTKRGEGGTEALAPGAKLYGTTFLEAKIRIFYLIF